MRLRVVAALLIVLTLNGTPSFGMFRADAELNPARVTDGRDSLFGFGWRVTMQVKAALEQLEAKRLNALPIE